MDIAELGIKVDSSDVKRGDDALGKFGRTASETESQVSRSSNNMTKSLMGFAKALVPIISAGAVVAGLKAMKGEAQQFGTALAEVSTLMDDLSDMSAVEQAAKDLAREFGGLPVDQVRSFYNIFSAGASDAAEATATLTAANKLAIGGVTDINTAVDGLTSTLNAYNLSGEYASAVSDRFFVAMRAGKTTIGEISSSIGQVASIASAAGVSLDELLASVSAITTGGVSTASAVTQVRQAIVSLLNPTKAASDMAAELGIQFDSQALRSKGLAGVLDDVKEATGGNLEQMAQLFGSVEAINAVLALTGPQGETFARILEDMGVAAGATEDAYAKMAGDMQNQTDQLTGKLAVMRIELGQKLNAAALPALKSLNENFETVMATIGLATKLVAAYVVAVYAIPAAKALASAATAAYGKVLTVFSGQVAMTTASLMTMRTALNVVIAAFAGWQIGSYLRSEFEIVERAGIALMAGLHRISISIGGTFTVLGEKIKFAMTSPFEFARNAAIDFLEWIRSLGGEAASALGFGGIAESLSADLSSMRSTAGKEHSALIADIRANTAREMQTVNDIYADMFADVGRASGDAASNVQEVLDLTMELGSSEGGAGAIGKTKDELDALAKAAEALQQAFEGAFESLHRRVTLAADASTEEGILYDIQHGRLVGINDAQQQMLLGMAQEIDMRERLKQIEDEQAEIDREAENIRLSLRTEEEALLESYARRREIVLAATFETEQARTAILEQLEIERNDRLAAIEQERVTKILDMNQQFYGGLAGLAKAFAGEHSTLYRAMFAVEQGFAVAKALMNAPKAYSEAYTAMVGIPYIGPVLAPAAGIAAAAAQVAQATQIRSITPSFDGGGHTGYGPRAGGVDGKGGFMAVMHPQERVVDEYRGQQEGGQQVVNFNLSEPASRRTQSQMARKMAESQQRQQARLG